MSRLVDGDKLYDHYNVTDPAGTFAYCSSIMQKIEAAPTIDAIPVDWLEEQRQGMENAEQDFPEQAIRYVLWLWRHRKEK